MTHRKPGPEGFTASLRAKLEAALGYKPCPTCGHVRRGTVRSDATRVGLTSASFFRFMEGKSPSAETIDAVVKFLAEHKR